MMDKEQERRFNEMAKVVEKYLQDYCHPHITIIADQSKIEVLEGIAVKPLEIPD